MTNQTITAVPGVRVGHWTDLEAITGVTVIDFPEPNVAAVDVRGGAPGSRETALLGAGKRVQMIQALVLSGGSAFGLGAADGVVRELERDGRGHETIAGKVPIVPSAILYDLRVGDASVRPGPEAGAAAYRAVSADPVPLGTVGAGTGAAVAGWRGPDAVRKGGIGSAAVAVDGAMVGVLLALNAVGDVFSIDGTPLTGGTHAPPLESPAARAQEQTVLVAVATDAALDREELMHLGVRAHDALGACIRPAHTRYDGDAVFMVSCGAAEGDVDVLGEATFVAVAEAVASAIRSATSVEGLPAVELP